MGTNYYLEAEQRPPCECCGRGYETPRQHIGKSSGGWCFSLHVDPEAGIHDLDDWRARWRLPGAVIRDEYGDVHTPEAMEAIITGRGRPGRDWGAGPHGYPDWATFHSRNHSEPGPRGLLRHRADGRFCLGHGAGTWDLIAGEFC